MNWRFLHRVEDMILEDMIFSLSYFKENDKLFPPFPSYEQQSRMYPSVVGQQSPINPRWLHLECDEQELLPPDDDDDDDDDAEWFFFVVVSFIGGAGSEAVEVVSLWKDDTVVGDAAGVSGLTAGRLMEDESGGFGPDGPGYKCPKSPNMNHAKPPIKSIAMTTGTTILINLAAFSLGDSVRPL
jgi:hypothetical protein